MQGYVDAAKTFRDEAGLAQETITGDAEERMLIRTALERGSVEEAIGRVNDLNPEVRHIRMLAKSSAARRDTTSFVNKL